MTTFLANDSLSQPLVIALEDLHWADTSSLKMLGFLGSRVVDSHLMVVGAYRDEEIFPEHPFSQTLATLSSEPSFRLETLRRFSAEDTGSLIEATGGLQPTEELIQKIQRHTEGNPLFVGEVVRLLDERGELESAEPGLAVPESVRAVTRQRLLSLSAECNRTLDAASIIGREFDLGLLRLLFPEAATNDVSDALEEAVGARLVEELQRQPGRYQFTHSLVQQALSEEFSASARAQKHADIAVSLEVHYGTEVDTRAAELAYHFAEAQTVLGTDRLVHYSLVAGGRAINSHAYEDATEHFQRGLSAKEGHAAQSNGAIDDETAALLDGLGRTQLAMLQVDEGWANLTRAFDHYAEVGDIPHAVAIANYPVSITSPGTIAPLLARALEMVPPDSYEAGRLLPWHGRLLNILQGNYEGAREALDRALAIAQREGDKSLEMRTLAMGADVEAYHFHYQESREKALQAIELGRYADDPLSDMFAHMYAGMSMTATGVDGEEARKHYAASLAAAERLGDRSWLSASRAFTGARYSGWGDWQRARDLSDSSIELSPEGQGLVVRAQLEYQLGNFREGELYLARMLENIRATPPEQSRSRNINMNVSLLLPLISRITGDTDRLDIAEEVAQIILSSPSFPPGLAIHATIGLALIAVQRRDVSAATGQYSALKSHSGTMETVLLPWISIDHLLGLLAHTMGNTGQAVTHFEDALNFCRKAGFQPELAWTCCDYADLLLKRDTEGDRAQASSLLDESLEIATKLGMRPLMERVTSRQELLGT